MGKTSRIHALTKVSKLRKEADLSIKVSPTKKGGNRLARRRASAGKSPHHVKGQENWRKNAQLWGRRWPKSHWSGVVDRSAVCERIKNKRCPIAVLPLAKELRAERERVRKPPQHTRVSRA